MFVNYLASRERASPVNLAVARVLLGTYLLWKVLPYDPRLWTDLPFVGFAGYVRAIPPAPVLVAEKWLLVAALVAFVVGYRTRWVALLASLLVIHLATVRYTVNTGGGTTALFFAAYLLVFFALYGRLDDLSADALRRTGTRPIEALRAHLKRDRDEWDRDESEADGAFPSGASGDGTGGDAEVVPRSFPTTPLLYGQLMLAIIYFGAGFAKLVKGGPAWFEPDNLTRTILVRNELFAMPVDLGLWVVQYPALVSLLAVVTVGLEVGLLVALLARKPLWPVMLGILGMHLAILPTMGMFFFDPLPLFALFVAWDRVLGVLARRDTLDVVFDEHCYFCARSLSPFAHLDVANRVRFYSQSDVPSRYATRSDADYGAAMYAFREGDATAYEGYDAFRELTRQLGFWPVWFVMGLPVVSHVGKPVYRYVADNRSTHFVCSLPFDDEDAADAPDAADVPNAQDVPDAMEGHDGVGVDGGPGPDADAGAGPGPSGADERSHADD
jgi:predicted DCC family thiol-disulfide oxidoreductase YuxK